MLHPVSGGFYVAEHDGRCGADAEGVSGGDDLDPLRHGDATPRDQVADVLIENLGRGAGQRTQPRRPQLCQILADGEAGAHRAVQHFLWRERMDMHVGQGAPNGPGEVDIVAAIELGR